MMMTICTRNVRLDRLFDERSINSWMERCDWLTRGRMRDLVCFGLVLIVIVYLLNIIYS